MATYCRNAYAELPTVHVDGSRQKPRGIVMSPETAIDIGRDAILLMLLASAPILITGLVVGLITGIFQAVTQINEQSLSFIPKLVAVVLVMSMLLPWILNKLVHYSTNLISEIPGGL